MNKKLFEYCQKHLRSGDRFKESASFKLLVTRYNIGYLADGYFYFDERAKQQLIEVVASEHVGIHLFRDPYPIQQTRSDIANTQRNEKVGALKVSEDFILINSLENLLLNQQSISMSPLASLGQYVCATEIKTIEHRQIVLVENLIVMANLRHLNIPACLQEALWVYRGDVQAQQQTGTAYSFFRRFQASHQLICFSDLDPSGLQISLTSNATHWLTLANRDDLHIALQGTEQEWFAQQKAISYLNNQVQLPEQCGALFHQMQQSQITLKQEHMLAHALELALYPLS